MGRLLFEDARTRSSTGNREEEESKIKGVDTYKPQNCHDVGFLNRFKFQAMQNGSS
jgi:hypothetical protein